MIYKYNNQYSKSIAEGCNQLNISLLQFLKYVKLGIIRTIKLEQRQGKEERIYYYEILKKLLPNDTIIPQFKILDFFVDIYFPEANLVVENNEPYHNIYNLKKMDEERREVFCRKLKCRFKVVIKNWII